MLPSELIRKKRFGGEHSREELQFLIQGYAQDRIPDYQMAAWLMAVCFSGMSETETAWLTEEMQASGASLDLRALGITVDKHSTGGVGDKVSLILAPLVAAAGVPVPMMAGRGLGHTGGTLDKLESIAGFNVNLSFTQFQKQVTELGCAIMGQTKEMCPADRKLYALRDVTGTIDSLPLICGSIMSKKLAEGMAGLVLDVKVGSGAFMKTEATAEQLARALMSLGRRCGKKVHALVTRMDEPLGRYIGNSLEVEECLQILDNRPCARPGKGYDDTVELTLQLAAHMIFIGKKAKTVREGFQIAKTLLEDGSARQKFEAMCHAQGGQLTTPRPPAKFKADIFAPEDGFIKYENVEKLGTAAVILGVGRRLATDVVDFAAGFEVYAEQGRRVKRGETLFTLYSSAEASLESAKPTVLQAFSVSPTAVVQSPLIAKVLT